MESISKPQDTGRRKFLTAAATAVGGAGVVGAGIPFLSSWQPSEKARAAGAPVQVDVRKLQTGQLLTVQWRGLPVFVLRRDESAVANLDKVTELVSDPDSRESKQPEFAANAHRSLNPEFLVLIAQCTHLGCAPSYRPEPGAEVGEDWVGGFFCPCHGSKFDLAGRVYKNVPAPTNLPVPEYQFLDDGQLLIGEVV